MKNTYCGRVFSPADLELIRDIIVSRESHPNRAAIARAVCERLTWIRLDGQPKLMSARLALLRMESDGLVVLPPPTCGNGNGRCRPSITTASDPGPPVEGTPKNLTGLGLRMVRTKKDSSLWNELIARYHYQGSVHWAVRHSPRTFSGIGHLVHHPFRQPEGTQFPIPCPYPFPQLPDTGPHPVAHPAFQVSEDARRFD